MSPVKRQHWVPRFYLRYFATPETRDSKKPRMWIFDKAGSDPTLTSIKNVAQQRYLYSSADHTGIRDWGMEQQFGRCGEVMHKVWPGLADGFLNLETDQSIRKALALFVSLLYLRHPRRLAE